MDRLIIPNIFLYNLLVLFSGLSPIYAILIERLTFLNNYRSFIVVSCGTFLITVLFTVFLRVSVSGFSAYINLILFIYPSFLLVSMFLFTYWNGVGSFSRSFAYSLMMVFLLTETHEIANFFFEYVGGISVIHNSWHPLSNLYAIIVGGILCSRLGFSWKVSLGLFGVLTVTSFIYLLFFREMMYGIVFRLIHFTAFIICYRLYGRF